MNGVLGEPSGVSRRVLYQECDRLTLCVERNHLRSAEMIAEQ